MNDRDALRPLPALNGNYDPPRPWSCRTVYQHQCNGTVVGSIGAIPVCTAGADVEVAARVADRIRIARFMEDNKELLAREAAAEQAFERRYS